MIFNKQNLLNKVKEAQQSTVVMDEGLRAYMLKVLQLHGVWNFINWTYIFNIF